MKILMLNPFYGKDFCRSARWAAKSRGRVQRHPDWMLISASVLEKAGHTVKFIDAAVLNIAEEEYKKILKEYMPEMIVCHTTTPSIYNDIYYCEISKRISECIIVLIGPHVSVMVEDTFNNASGCVDVVVRGEYDITLKELASGITLNQIKGISYFSSGTVVNNPDRDLLDVNDLPFPAWHHIDPRWYWDPIKRFPFLTVISARGCLGKCTFCRDTPVMYGGKLRLRDPGAIVDEIEYDLKLFPFLREIMFETDTFTASAEHVKSICEEMLKRNIGITWSCNVRTDIDLDLLPLMKKAGCRMLMVGFEFGTQQALNVVHKGITVDKSRRFAETAQKLGFVLHGCFMIGAPGETKESARKTIDFAKSLPLDTIQISGICVYPGTEMYDWAKMGGYLVPNNWKEWVGENNEQVTLLNYPDLTKEEIDKLIDMGLREFYFRPKQIIKMLFNMRNKGDLLRKIFGFKSYMEYLFKSLIQRK